ncbi:MAG TPA: hypothetical protein VI894_01885 [Candidatus Nanoarchaeia archaeon]|nr:hypothetical protein [Candidatus Nanoarchaeia archaeon]
MTKLLSQKFQGFMNNVYAGKYHSPKEVDPEIFTLQDWELLTREEAEKIFLPFIRHQIASAIKTMPNVYEKLYKENGIKPENIKSMKDFWNVPPLVKDSTVDGLEGLRFKASQDPYILLPTDVETGTPATAYFSGGTKGGNIGATPTWITKYDLEVESNAFVRTMMAGGIKPRSVVINTYNSSHKGGFMVSSALQKLNCIQVQVKSTDTADEIIRYIRQYKKNGRQLVFIGAQPPISRGDAQKKGGGRTLFDIISKDEDTFLKNVDLVLLGGFRIIPEVEAWSAEAGIPTHAIFGSTEILPAFFGKAIGDENRLCKYNNLHLSYGPHYMELVKLNEEGKLVPVKEGEEGLLALTSVFREGTILIRYLIGDAGRFFKKEGSCCCGVNTEIWTDIDRKDIPLDILQKGCVGDV